MIATLRRLVPCLLLVVTLMFAALTLGSPARGAIAEPEKTLRIYFVGNSVTDTINYQGLALLAESRGIRHEWGRHMIPGAPLSWIVNRTWNGMDEGFREKPYGNVKNAVENHIWDAISLQPFDRKLVARNREGTEEGDLAMIQRIVDPALKRNPELSVYIYSRWPRMTVGGKSVKFDKDAYRADAAAKEIDLSQLDDWSELWSRPFNPQTQAGSVESRAYFEAVVRGVRNANPGVRHAARIVPVGDVMNALHQKMKAGEVPGYTTVWQLYMDGIHLKPEGSYLVGCTFFAVLHQQSPVGLPTEPYGAIDPAFAGLVQETVWQVVREHELAGLR